MLQYEKHHHVAVTLSCCMYCSNIIVSFFFSKYTGNEGIDDTISMFMANPVFMAGLLACLLDNTMPGNCLIFSYFLSLNKGCIIKNNY